MTSETKQRVVDFFTRDNRVKIFRTSQRKFWTMFTFQSVDGNAQTINRQAEMASVVVNVGTAHQSELDEDFQQRRNLGSGFASYRNDNDVPCHTLGTGRNADSDVPASRYHGWFTDVDRVNPRGQSAEPTSAPWDLNQNYKSGLGGNEQQPSKPGEIIGLVRFPSGTDSMDVDRRKRHYTELISSLKHYRGGVLREFLDGSLVICQSDSLPEPQWCTLHQYFHPTENRLSMTLDDFLANPREDHKEKATDLLQQWNRFYAGLSEAGFVHGDISLVNIVIDGDNKLKVVDYDAMVVSENTLETADKSVDSNQPEWGKFLKDKNYSLESRRAYDYFMYLYVWTALARSITDNAFPKEDVKVLQKNWFIVDARLRTLRDMFLVMVSEGFTAYFSVPNFLQLLDNHTIPVVLFLLVTSSAAVSAHRLFFGSWDLMAPNGYDAKTFAKWSGIMLALQKQPELVDGSLVVLQLTGPRFPHFNIVDYLPGRGLNERVLLSPLFSQRNRLVSTTLGEKLIVIAPLLLWLLIGLFVLTIAVNR